MAKTDAASTKDFVDHSYFYKPYSIAAAIGFILWAAYVCWTGYWGIMKGRLPVIDIGMQLAILWWLLDTVRTKTVYRLEKDRLYMLKTGLWRKQELSIAYDDIFGVEGQYLYVVKNDIFEAKKAYQEGIILARLLGDSSLADNISEKMRDAMKE